MEGDVRKVSSLKEGEDNVSVRVRVIKTMDPKVIDTRKGPRTISEAIVGDETGRIKLTLWGKHAGTLKEGQAVEVSGAWTTSYRGEVQLNVGYKGELKDVAEEDVPSEDEIPEETPKAQNPRRVYQGPPRRRNYTGYKSRRSYGKY